jgi:hypothetical protein
MMVPFVFVQSLEKSYKLRSSNSDHQRTIDLTAQNRVVTYKRSKYPLFQVGHCKIIHIIRNTVIVHLPSASTVFRGEV